jgi:hypothetical protein
VIKKFTMTANTGNRNKIKATSKIVPELVTELEPAIELEFMVVELEFNTSVELFNITVEFKSKSCCTINVVTIKIHLVSLSSSQNLLKSK